MNRKHLLIIAGGLFLLFCFYKLASAFAPGSYPYAECYELNYPENKVIEAAEIVKKQNNYIAYGKFWEDNDTSDHWHHIYFNFHDSMLLTWTRPNGKNITTFAFVSMQDENSEWKDINNDFGYFENRKLKKKLEKEILDKIKIELEKKHK